LWTTQERCPQAPQAQQQQQKRTIDVLQSTDIFTRYGQGPMLPSADVSSRHIAPTHQPRRRMSVAGQGNRVWPRPLFGLVLRSIAALAAMHLEA
jgi:hypothetical protein